MGGRGAPRTAAAGRHLALVGERGGARAGTRGVRVAVHPTLSCSPPLRKGRGGGEGVMWASSHRSSLDEC